MNRALVTSLLFALLASPSVATQPSVTNLGFEEGQPGQVPKGWFVPTGGYKAEVAQENPKSGERCVVLASAEGWEDSEFGNVMQTVDPAPYRGKRIRFRAAVRAEVSREHRAQLWLRVDRAKDQPGFFYNMNERPVRVSQWQYYEIIGDVHEDAKGLNFGLILVREGRAWLDDISLEVIGPGDADFVNGRPANLDLEDAWDGTRPAGWVVATPGYRADLTEENPRSGKHCLALEFVETREKIEFGNIMQTVDAAPYRGKRVCFRAAVRAEVSGHHRGQLWLRVDRPGKQRGFFDNMQDRPIKDSKWGYYEIVGDVAEDAVDVNFGLMLAREGRVWLDDVSIAVVDEE